MPSKKEKCTKKANVKIKKMLQSQHSINIAIYYELMTSSATIPIYHIVYYYSKLIYQFRLIGLYRAKLQNIEN